MSANFFILCLSIFILHVITGQCTATVYNGIIGAIAPESALPCGGVGHGLPGYTPSHGGGFAVTSASPIAPNGVTIVSDNLIVEGALSVCGQLPVLGTAALEGPLPAAGQGAVEYGCGDGEVGIISEVSPDGSFMYVGPVIDYSQIGLTPASCSYVY
ncbi:PREDICTED: chorion class B protein PC10-like [Papilio xuthus]|uniref:Chorion class B protein PC10-like n=1 Tax=Papilio xuthus TaxID=66420 RepID=A0AAJ7EFS0_PAPXU|nr:PREDICTED: chorion class B protein PC10-like [Papilio xuthus]